jgi:DNA helicase-2/ATP-dependent DNA helicase PcrA
MTWQNGLLEDQKLAASHVGSHARLLAGPGTGKTLTLTRRICFLVNDQSVPASEIVALTFTRAAAKELRQRVEAELGPDQKPRISTLHSFALRQLIRNSGRVLALPRLLRIADDWEERHIILEDLKSLLQLEHIDQARDLLNELSADWQSLTADQADWEKRFPNPRFLGAWREHKQCYGYILRSELVYQLKRALEQCGSFDFGGQIRHLLVDEYQDLNRCDLAIVKEIAKRRAEVFVAGDDDQSIYGFRKAHPAGIRRFPQDYEGGHDIALQVCKRCDPEILELSLFVARQDYERIEKPIRADDGRDGGQVALLRFRDQVAEAQGIARLCRHLLDKHGLQSEDILILLRQDRRAVFSSVIREALESISIPVVASTEDVNSFNRDDGRKVIAMLRLLANSNDHLAWRTLLQLRINFLGPVAIQTLYRLAREHGTGFAHAIQMVVDDLSLVPAPYGARIRDEVRGIRSQLQAIMPDGGIANESTDTITAVFNSAVKSMVHNAEEQQQLLDLFQVSIQGTNVASIPDLLGLIESPADEIEQEVKAGRVNILTMHKAKGLTSKAVITLALEDEYLPGKATGDSIGDERRLLYVSLTRAKHFLFMTYCSQRTGQQQHTGRTSGKPDRSLTQFLRDGPITPSQGEDYTCNL